MKTDARGRDTAMQSGDRIRIAGASDSRICARAARRMLPRVRHLRRDLTALNARR